MSSSDPVGSRPGRSLDAAVLLFLLLTPTPFALVAIHALGVIPLLAGSATPAAAADLSAEQGGDPIAAAWLRAALLASRSPEPAGRRPGQRIKAWQVKSTRPSRTLFEKFAENPVLPLGASGSLDSGHAEYPSIVEAGDLMWLYYSAFGAHRRWEIAAAVSPDGISWTKIGVVLEPDTTAGAWDSTTIAFPCVIYRPDSPDGEPFRMWYAGKRGPYYDGIGLATSADGRRWRRGGRVMSAGASGEWDGGQIVDPTVIAVPGGYRMYYCGSSEPKGLFAAGVALSADGIHWVKSAENPVYAVEPSGSGKDGAAIPGRRGRRGDREPEIVGPPEPEGGAEPEGRDGAAPARPPERVDQGVLASERETADETPAAGGVDRGGGIYTIDVLPVDTGFVLFESSPTRGGRYRIHAVHSADGLHFDAAERRLALTPTIDRAWDAVMVYGMDVKQFGDTVYMWFNGVYALNVTEGGQVGLARAPLDRLMELVGAP